MPISRRTVLSTLAASPLLGAAPAPGRFKVSLAEWSIHRLIRQGKATNLDFPRIARENGCEGLEFVNTLWASPTAGYIARLRRRMDEAGVRAVLIMVDDEGQLGHSDPAVRRKAVKNHHKWVDIAAELGCHSIRTNMHSDLAPKTPAENDRVLGCCADSFTALCEYARQAGINVLVENHWGLSSDPGAVVALMKKVNLPNFGTLPDFGNFPPEVDKYEAVARLAAYAKGMSFKCYFEGPDGSEDRYDFRRMMQVVEASPYSGYIGIEYEGNKLGELEGVARARQLLREYGI